ncbi:uncharacterized domain 1-containing protein [Marinobacter daqiaonensis]|uniref:Uncharacterized domain 1-containing protein n=1 Tax=Marinobacter daqiaonensis TaxID=650891 RepID=A0A1I6GID1_9GAMM|nr:PaaI family thioesterase [Marinobacter daqiaonensis]SFR41891.1 uncharacterized domain 1-containing protein [Marinobacter daqiaonensis]
MTDKVLVDRVARFINILNQARDLGLAVADADSGQLTLCLPYSEKIIGNPETRVIHGGAITTLMDTTSGSVMICALDEFELCPTLDLRVDYMRPAEPDKAVYARAEIRKMTRNIVFTRCEAYQEGGEVIATCVGTFMRIGREATPKAYRDMIMGTEQ